MANLCARLVAGMGARSVLSVSVAAALIVTAHAEAGNMILNGSFEHNSAAQTRFNLTNSEFAGVVSDATAFGFANEIDLITDDVAGGQYGPTPADGKWKLAIHAQGPGRSDAFAFHLDGSIVAGRSYALSFLSALNTTFDFGVGPLEIGVSDSPGSFGTVLLSLDPLSNRSWSLYAGTLTAPTSGSFLTVRAVPDTDTWIHLDAFSLAEVPAPGTLGAMALAGACLVRRRRIAPR